MWLFREVSSPYLFILAQIDPDIKWRAHSFRLKFGGIAELREQVNYLYFSIWYIKCKSIFTYNYRITNFPFILILG